MGNQVFMQGNQAMAESAIRAGCKLFFGYPITPSSEVPEYYARAMRERPEEGITFIQAETEVAAFNMVAGAAATGHRAMTATSGPGFSLGQEAMSYMSAADLPAVIVEIMRAGPADGEILAAQGDYFQATKGGGNGDYHMITYAPASIQEAINILGFAYDKAEKYRVPVMILADGIMAQMMEPVEMPEMVDYKVDPEKKPWAATGWKPGDDPAKRAVINSLYINTEELTVHNNNLQAIYREIEKNEEMYETYLTEDADIVITAFGTVARIAKSAINDLREQGIKVGLFRPITVWPFPYAQLADAVKGAKAILDVEVNEGQMMEDVRLAVNGALPVDYFGYCGSQMPTTEEIKAKILNMKEGI